MHRNVFRYEISSGTGAGYVRPPCACVYASECRARLADNSVLEWIEKGMIYWRNHTKTKSTT